MSIYTILYHPYFFVKWGVEDDISIYIKLYIIIMEDIKII